MRIKVLLEKVDNAHRHGVPPGQAVEMEIEEYLLGVVPAEIGNASPEACKAQAIAARTKALAYADKEIPISDKSEKAQSYRAVLVGDASFPNAHSAV